MFLLTTALLVSTVSPTLSQHLTGQKVCHGGTTDSELCPTKEATALPCSEPEWKRVVFVNMTDPDQKECPPGLHLITKPVRMCGRNASSDYMCNSTTFSVGGSSYSKVCGRIRGYQYGSTFTFLLYFNYSCCKSIEKAYLDGVSLTHGAEGKRQHIWSFASAYNQVESGDTYHIFCPASNKSTTPPFVGNDYFCDSGFAGTGFGGYVYHTEDPLWNGEGCQADPLARCKTNDPPWFTKTLPSSTKDDIEMRICAGNGISDSDTPVDLIELYIQ